MPTVRTKVRSLRHTAEELDLWERAAAGEGLNYSDFVRETVNARIEGHDAPRVVVPSPGAVLAGSSAPHAPGCFCVACRGGS